MNTRGIVEKKINRFMELEGLRGLAAVAVVLGHFFAAFYPVMAGVAASFTQHMRLEDNIHGNPLAIFFSGGFAVIIFFILSGFVLTIGYFQTKRAEIIKSLAARRYLRLMLPALASVLLCLILIKLNIASIDRAAVLTQSSWLTGAWHFNSSLLDAVYNGTLGIFLHGKSSYNNVLWTMSSEFVGSFMVFGFALLFGKAKHRWILYVVLLVVTFNTLFMAFVIGMILADLYSHDMVRDKLKLKAIHALPLVAAGIFFGGYPNGEVQGTIYEFLRLHMLDGFHLDFYNLYWTFGAGLLVFAAIFSRSVAMFLGKPRINILGRYTFSLYLVHIPVLYVFTTFVFVNVYDGIGYNAAVVAAFVVSVPVLYVCTLLFERYIDRPSISAARWCANIFEGKEELHQKELYTSIKRRTSSLAYRFRTRRAADYVIDEGESS